MLRVSRLADYAVLLAGRMAREPARTFTAAALARETHLPAPTVTKVLAALTRAGLILSQRGPGGGYRSARSAADISVGDVIAAIDGPVALTICAEGSDACDLMEICPSAANWQRINDAIRSTLEGISLEELTGETWKGKLVVENPATSSPGLAFLIATVSYFGEDDDYDYLDFWADLRANDVAITDGWSDAYYTNFTKYGGNQPLVVSYATSPAAEFFFSETPLDDAPTGNILFDRSVFLQIEGMGVLDGADSPLLARKFIDFALELQFQEDFPDKMFVYPVNENATLPDFWRFAEEPAVPADIGPDEISENREAWIEAWTRVMLR